MGAWVRVIPDGGFKEHLILGTHEVRNGSFVTPQEHQLTPTHIHHFTPVTSLLRHYYVIIM